MGALHGIGRGGEFESLYARWAMEAPLGAGTNLQLPMSKERRQRIGSGA